MSSEGRKSHRILREGAAGLARVLVEEFGERVPSPTLACGVAARLLQEQAATIDELRARLGDPVADGPSGA